MVDDSSPYQPFSQRAGLAPIPPQLQMGEVSDELRRLIEYYLCLEIDRESYAPYGSSVFDKKWLRVAKDIHVVLFKQSLDTFSYSPFDNQNRYSSFVRKSSIGGLFDFVEFLVRHPGCSVELKRELASAFVAARAAYRVFDNKYIAAIGNEEQAAAFERAVRDAEVSHAAAARKQLVAAGVALRDSDWVGCVRESIHAVEAVAVRLAPGTDTLGAALRVIEQRGHLHGSLKAVFGSLYGYTSDEGGVRHALVFGDEAQVDEADALFMLGACASFVSYLLARGT